MTMHRVAVFGNAGGGKSRLARRLAEITGLPLFVIDKMKFKPGGEPVPEEEFLAAHADVLRSERWIIDGYGGVALAWERFARADTLVHVDLPLATHYWWVTKRLIGGLFAGPKGWPDNTPLWSSSWQSYKVIGSCHRTLTPKYRQLVAEAAATKRVHHLRAPAEMADFLAAEEQYARSPAVVPANGSAPSTAR
jgi:adenylate kinase family enzyme